MGETLNEDRIQPRSSTWNLFFCCHGGSVALAAQCSPKNGVHSSLTSFEQSLGERPHILRLIVSGHLSPKLFEERLEALSFAFHTPADPPKTHQNQLLDPNP